MLTPLIVPGLALWCAATVPVGVALGRAFAAGQQPEPVAVGAGPAARGGRSGHVA